MTSRQAQKHIISNIAALAGVYGNSNLIKLADMAGETYMDDVELAKTDGEVKNDMFNTIMATHMVTFPGEAELNAFKAKLFAIFDETKV